MPIMLYKSTDTSPESLATIITIDAKNTSIKTTNAQAPTLPARPISSEVKVSFLVQAICHNRTDNSVYDTIFNQLPILGSNDSLSTSIL